jgi:hypothetical protein
VKSLGGSDINSISESSDNKSGSITKVLITISEAGIANLEVEISTSGIIATLELCLPQEVIIASAIGLYHVVNDITRVSIHSNQTHDLLSLGLSKVTLYKHNQVLKVLLLLLECFWKSILLATSIGYEGFLDKNNPVAVVDQQDDLCWISKNPSLFIHSGKLLDGSD